MNYINFTKELEQLVQKKLGEQYQVSMIQILKNNGLTKDAILIKENNSNLCPNIYLEHFYERFCECESLDEISDEIINFYHEASSQKPQDMEDYFAFENYRKRLFLRIIHFESNQILLENVPYIPYLDLAITFHCLISDYHQGMHFFTVSNALLEEWGISVDKLYQIALENTQHLFPAHIDTLEHILNQLLYTPHSYQTIFSNTNFETELSNISDQKKFQIFVITNQYGVNGATVILYPHLLEHIAEKLQSNLYLLPSSIHEFLVLSDAESFCQTLSEMVSKVNTHEVSKEEILSNQVYFYDWKAHRLTEKADN